MQTLCNLSGREGEVEGHQNITLDHKGEGGGQSGLKKDYVLFLKKNFPLQQTKKDSYEPYFDTTGMVGFWNDL